MVLLLPVILASCKIVRLIDYWPVGILLGLQLLTNATMTSLGRYFDASVFFCLWTLTRDLKARMDERSASLGRIFRGAILLAAAMLLAGQLRGWSRQIDLARLIRRRALAASGEAHRLIPRDAFVITDCPQLWTWYGLGDFCCFVPMGHPETLRLLLDKFPHAYILLFIPGRAGYSMAPFHRPVLNRSTFLALGPPDRAKAVQ
jgi:hypothetical protein